MKTNNNKILEAVGKIKIEKEGNIVKVSKRFGKDSFKIKNMLEELKICLNFDCFIASGLTKEVGSLLAEIRCAYFVLKDLNMKIVFIPEVEYINKSEILIDKKWYHGKRPDFLTLPIQNTIAFEVSTIKKINEKRLIRTINIKIIQTKDWGNRIIYIETDQKIDIKNIRSKITNILNKEGVTAKGVIILPKNNLEYLSDIKRKFNFIENPKNQTL